MRTKSIKVIRDKLLHCREERKIGGLYIRGPLYVRPVVCPVAIERTTEARCSLCIFKED